MKVKFLSLYIAAPVSALLLACSSLYTSLYLLAWVALVPFLLSLSRCQSTSQAYKLGLLTGFFIYALSTYWVVSFIITLKAYSLITAIALACLYWFYCAQLFGLVAVFTVYLSKKWPSVWVFPLVLTVFFAFFPSLFSIQLGETQSEFLIALQGSAYTGVYGLDFIMALSNVLIAQAIVRPLSAEKKYHAKLACALVSLWFAYGVYSFNHWEAQINEGALVNVGIVQPDRGVGHNEVQVLPGYTLSYPVEMALSDALVAQGADVIVWPELPSKRYYEQEKIREAYQYQVSQWQVPLIFQDNQNQVLDGEVAKYSASTYLDAQGQQAAFYQKTKRIPFVEYLPAIGGSENSKRLIKRYLNDFFSDLSPGNQVTTFKTDKANFVPLICYEVIFSGFVAEVVNALEDPQVLLVQSNNGWFGETRQPYQHLGASVLRSVENRLPLVHVMNNGPSAVVLPSGRKLFQSDRGQESGYLVQMPVSDTAKTSFYTRNPYSFLWLLSSLFLLMLTRSLMLYKK